MNIILCCCCCWFGYFPPTISLLDTRCKFPITWLHNTHVYYVYTVYFLNTCQVVCFNAYKATNGFKLRHAMQMNQKTELNLKDCGEAAGQFSLDFAFHYKSNSDSHPKSSKNILCASNFSCLAIWEYLLQMTRNTYQMPGNFEKMPNYTV